MPDLVDDQADPVDGGTASTAHSEDDRELTGNNLHGDSAEDSGYHRGGEELGYPSQTEQANGEKQCADY